VESASTGQARVELSREESAVAVEPSLRFEERQEEQARRVEQRDFLARLARSHGR
jgi:hypothetical protein